MERLGFIRDMLDVKVLILFVAARLQRPTNMGKIYELCFQDDRLSYFDVCEAIPQLVETGHLRELDGGLYEITDEGREIEAIMGETVAFPVAERAKAAVEKHNNDARRAGFMRTDVTQKTETEVTVSMELFHEGGKLMGLELSAPTLRQGRKLERTFRENAERIYKVILDQFLNVPDDF